MADDSSVASLLREARLVYGGVLVDGTAHLIECIDRGRFEDGSVDAALRTAFASIGSDLVPFVVDAEERVDGVGSAPSGLNTSDDHPRITTFDAAITAVSGSRTYYLLIETDPGSWKRVRNVRDGDLGADGDVSSPDPSKYVVAAALVGETSDRIGDLAGEVDGQDVDVIDWSE